jgi:hypothetical protein
MRLIVLGVCLFAAACSGQASNSPTSPTSASLGPASPASASFEPAQTEARGGTDLPFRGSYTSVIEVPPPSARGTVEGTATHLGRFTGTATAEVDGNFATGKFTFIAANGDQLSGTFLGEGVFMPPSTVTRTERATIENGTGRFAGATGTFTMVTVDTIDFANGGTATGYGSFEGRINLNE